MANYNGLTAGYKRLFAGPLEYNTIFSSYDEAFNYVSTNKTAYAGQVIVVVDSETGVVTKYIIQSDKSLKVDGRVFTREIVQADTDDGHYMIVNHRLNAIPTVIITALVNDGEGEVEQSVEVQVEYLDMDSVRLDWNDNLKGYVNIIA